MDEAKKNSEENQLNDPNLEQVNGGNENLQIPVNANRIIAYSTVRDTLEW